MEEDIAILIADLAGYTAMTETHGATVAADIIEAYIKIVEKNLPAGINLHERSGDEVMLVAASPDQLLATALLIMRDSAHSENFLQVHGGLHYGKVLKRRNSYFGAAVNLTARLASIAEPGTLSCSQAFVQALENRDHPFVSKGMHVFKNLRSETEVLELAAHEPLHYAVDPICKMLILDKEAAIRDKDGGDVYFCSKKCRDIYSIQNTA